jgi:hypothetical protein
MQLLAGRWVARTRSRRCLKISTPRGNHVPFDPSARCTALSSRGLDRPVWRPGRDWPRCTVAFPQIAGSRGRLQAMTREQMKLQMQLPWVISGARNIADYQKCMRAPRAEKRRCRLIEHSFCILFMAKREVHFFNERRQREKRER